MKVTLFTDINAFHLEKAINAWLSQHPDIDIVDIRYAVAKPDSDATLEYSALVLYKTEDYYRPARLIPA